MMLTKLLKPRPRDKGILPLMLLAMLVFTGITCGRAEDVVLHLRSGDRISGSVLSEDSSQIVISNTWNQGLSVPLTQIQAREPLASGLVSSQSAEADKQETNSIVSTLKAPIKKNEFADKWSGEVRVGADVEQGAKDHHDYNAHAKLVYAHPYKRDSKEFFRNILTYDAQYGRDPTTLTEDKMNGTSKTDLDINRRYYAYNLGSAGYDKVRLINIRYEDGPGFGYHWITRSNFQANLEFGANYQVEERAGDVRDESFYLRFGEETNWKITKQASFMERFEFYPRTSNAAQYRMRFESTLSYALILNLSLNLTASDLYDSHPADSVPNNDFQLRTSVGVKF